MFMQRYTNVLNTILTVKLLCANRSEKYEISIAPKNNPRSKAVMAVTTSVLMKSYGLPVEG